MAVGESFEYGFNHMAILQQQCVPWISAAGGAGVALTGGAEMLYYNPAGYIDDKGSVLFSTRLFSGLQNSYRSISNENGGNIIGGFRIKSLPASRLLVGFRYNYINDIPKTDFVDPNSTELTQVGTSSFSDVLVSLGSNYSVPSIRSRFATAVHLEASARSVGASNRRKLYHRKHCSVFLINFQSAT